MSIEDELRELREEIRGLRGELPSFRDLFQRPTTGKATSSPEYVPLKMAAQILNVGYTTIRKMIRHGKLPALGDGRLKRVRVRDLEAALSAGAPGERSAARSADDHADAIIERMRARGSRS